MRMTALALAVMVIGCGDGDDGGETGPRFSQKLFPESVTAAMGAYAEVQDAWEPRDLDFASCAPDPEPTGGFCTLQAQVIDFEDDTFLPQLGGTTVKVFPSNRVDDPSAACEPPGDGSSCSDAAPTCFEGQADESGRVDFPCMPCNTRFAVWTYKAPSAVPITKKAVEFDHWIGTSTAARDVFTVSIKTYNLIPGIVGFDPNPEFGILAGKASDCSDNNVTNLAVNIDKGTLDAPAEPCFCGDDTIYGVGTFYFVDNFPQKEQDVSSEDGLWAFVNVPPGPVTVFGSGRREDGGAIEQNVGRAHAAAFPDTIVIADLVLEAP